MELFRTQRTVVRPFQDSDLEFLILMMTDGETMRFTGFKTPQTKERIIELLTKWKADGLQPLGVWAVENIETQKLVAWFMLKKTVSDDPELGFMIEKTNWNKGYATEISQGFLNYAFTKLKINRVIASCSPENSPSLQVIKKTGMTPYKEKKPQGSALYFEILFTPKC